MICINIFIIICVVPIIGTANKKEEEVFAQNGEVIIPILYT